MGPGTIAALPPLRMIRTRHLKKERDGDEGKLISGKASGVVEQKARLPNSHSSPRIEREGGDQKLGRKKNVVSFKWLKFLHRRQAGGGTPERKKKTNL